MSNEFFIHEDEFNQDNSPALTSPEESEYEGEEKAAASKAVSAASPGLMKAFGTVLVGAVFAAVAVITGIVYVPKVSAVTKTAPHVHTPGEWTVETEPTCMAEGKKVQLCTECGTLLAEETIPLGPHTPGEWVTDKEPTCAEEGHQSLKCSFCDTLLDEKTLPMTEHIPGEAVITLEPSCTEAGRQTVSCTFCGIPLGEEALPALGHDYQITDTTGGKNPCINDTKITYTCSRCTAKYTEKVKATGHKHVTKYLFADMKPGPVSVEKIMSLFHLDYAEDARGYFYCSDCHGIFLLPMFSDVPNPQNTKTVPGAYYP